VYRFPKVNSINETLDKLQKKKCSIVRFGDSEFLYILDKINLPYQEYDKTLACELQQILRSDIENILVGLPIGFHSHANLTSESRLFWRVQIVWIYSRLRRLLNLNREYDNASITRIYADYVDKAHCKATFEKFMMLWKGREVVLIEGEKSRLGVGNNLFFSALSVKRVLGPSHNAFHRCDEILNFISSTLKNDVLILASLGPAAKVISFRLAGQGYQVLDIGNLDIEYEWYLRGATSKVIVPGKYTSEAKGGRIVADISDKNYESQIIARFI
jgi:glycosyltransferase family protein